MTLHSFPKALETAAPSDRDVVPPDVPVAPIAVRCQVYSVTNSSSQAGDDGWPGVPRYISIRSIPGPFSGGRGTSPGVVNFWRALRAWSFGILAQPAKQSRCRFTKCFEVLSAVFVHDEHNGRRMRQSAVKE
jgi:hypothetical protein